MLGGTMEWLLIFVITFISCYWCLAKFLRVHVEKNRSPGFPTDIPFPLWIYALFIPAALVPAFVFATFLRMSGVI